MTNLIPETDKKSGKQAGKPRKRVRESDIFELVEYGICFLLSKVFLFGVMSPFAIPVFAATFPKHKRFFAIVSVLLGLLSGGMGLRFLPYAAAVIITASTLILMKQELADKPRLSALFASLSVFVTGLVFVIFNGFLLYDFLCLLLESLFCFFAYFLFKEASDVIRTLRHRHVFDPAETMSLLCLCAAVFVSFFSVPALVGMAHVLSLTVILATALTCGFSLAGTAGILFGLVASLTADLPAETVATYGVLSLAAGLLQKKGRWGVLLAAFVSGTVSMACFSGNIDEVLEPYHILAAGVLLFLLPDHLLYTFGDMVGTPLAAEDSVERIRAVMTDRLSSASASFSALSDVFDKAVENRINQRMRDPGVLFDKTAETVCRDCSLMKFCWQKEYNETRRVMISLYERMRRKGFATGEDVPEHFRNGCIRLEPFLKQLNQNYEVHKVNLLWAGRVMESRHLVAEQFKNISSVLDHLQAELSAESMNSVYQERRLLSALDRKGLIAESVRVTGVDAREVVLRFSEEAPLPDAREVTAIVSKVVDVPMLKVPASCGDSPHVMRLAVQGRYTMEAGFAQVASHGDSVCGDNHLFSLSADGKFVLALSDGMGQGSDAEAQSQMTVHLLRRLLSAGFDKETALRLMNSMLLATDERECFATADLCFVNLYSGALEFIKIGASQSFVKSGEMVETVSCSSLPAGIVCNVEADRDLKYAKEGDFVVLVTDGVTDALSGETGGALAELISRFAGDSPQALADEILKTAVMQAGGKPKDDMTVIAAKLIAA